MEDLDYYMTLPYTIEVVPIPESLGGGFTARLPEIGRLAITGDGETPEEAIKNLEEVKHERFSEYLKKGLKIPKPEGEKEAYSGRFIVRLPTILHRQLSLAAKQNQISLNQYVNYLLTANFHLDKHEKKFDTILYELGVIENLVWDITYGHPLYEIEKLYGDIEETEEIKEIGKEIGKQKIINMSEYKKAA